MVYRKDIQILRGLSVLAVLLFHLETPGFGNGFLGVDIFFVISGFLMALLYDAENKKDFFLRRARRLLPAYFTVILVTLIAVVLVTTPNEFSFVQEQSLYALLFSSNIGYWMENSYFSKAAFKPLLHLWSLGVELQFYLLVPLLAWLFRRSRFFLPALAATSVLACFLAVQISPKTAFFMTPLRLWEFLIGYAAATYFVAKDGSVKIHSMSWLGVCGLVIMALASVFPMQVNAQDFVYGHPGIFALVMCVATALVLVFGLPSVVERTQVGRFLEYAGNYSYSLYLVHFPVIVLYLYEPFLGTRLRPDGLWETVSLLVIILVLTGLLHHFVESPNRRHRNLQYWLSGAAVLIVVVAAFGNTMQGLRFSMPERLVFQAWYDRAHYRCGKLVRFLDPTAVSCEINEVPSARATVLLVGNSHADSIKTAFGQVAAEMNISARLTASNTPLMKGGLTVKQVIEDAQNRKVQAIVLHYSMNSVSTEVIRDLVNEARARGIAVAYIEPIPAWKVHIPLSLYRNITRGDTLPTQDIEQYDLAQQEKRAEYSMLGAEKGALTVFSTAEYFCMPECRLQSPEGRPFYFDRHHLTLTGGEVLKPLFRNVLSQVVASPDGSQASF